MSVNYFRGSDSFFVSYANADDADAFFGHFTYHSEIRDYDPSSGANKLHFNFKYKWRTFYN